jgi:hypothetical protein
MTKPNVPRQRFWLAGNREPDQDVFFKEALDPSRWQAGDADGWDTCWHTGMPAPDVFDKLTATKSINHIPGNNSLTVKSNLHATLAAARERMAEQAGEAADNVGRLGFFPRVYSMPAQYHALQEAALAAPGKRWILKPKNSARGKGIELVRDVASVPLGDKWMVQEYIDNPHLMNGHKYVLRLYVLITSVEPLRVYLYKEGSAKLASARYDLGDLRNRYAHLTNPDVNANNRDSRSPVVFHSLAHYRGWLRDEGHDDEELFARIRDMVALTVIAARENMRARCQAVQADTSGCYELLGVDCLVDSDLKPWIMECNLSPSLDICAAPQDGGDIEARTKRQLVADTVRLVGIDEPATDRSALPPTDRIRLEAEAELSRAGDFSRIYPASDAIRYLPFFPLPRLADMVLADAVADTPLPRPKVAPRHTAELITNDGLSLYAGASGTLYAPNASAAWIWLRAADGADPDEITDELLASRRQSGAAADDWAVRRQVWDSLADWAASGLLFQGSSLGSLPATKDLDGSKPEHPRTLTTSSEPEQFALRVGRSGLRLRPRHRSVAARLEGLLLPLRISHVDGECLEVLQSARGYTLAAGGRVLADGLNLARVAPALCRILQERSVREEHECAIAGLLIPMDLSGTANGNGAAPAIFVPRHAGGAWDVLALSLAARLRVGHAGGIRLVLGAPAEVLPIGLPARVAEDDAERLVSASGGAPIAAALSHLHEWASGERGYLVPAALPTLNRSYEISMVIVPTGAAPGPGEAPYKPIGVHEALAAMLPSAIGAEGASLPGEAVRKLGEWLTGRPLWSVNVSDLAAAVDVILSNLCGHGPAATVPRTHSVVDTQVTSTGARCNSEAS